MNNSKLISLLRTFSKSEMKELEKVVASPYFNKGRNFMPLLKELKKFHPKFDNEKMTPEYIFKKMYPAKKFSKHVIWNMSSALLNMAEELLIQITLGKNSFVRNNHIADELYERKVSRNCGLKLDAMEKDVNSMPVGSNFFLHNIQLQICRINLRFLEDEQHLVSGNVMKEGESVIMYFLMILTNVINNLHYNMLLYNTRYEINLPYEFINRLQLEEIIEYAKNNKYKYAGVLEMYLNIIKSSLNPDESSFFLRAKELFEQKSSYIEQGEREIILGIFSNYCLYKINGGDGQFKRNLFEVNQLILKDIEEKKKSELGKIFYMQTIRNALMIEELNWAKLFINKYTSFLKNSYQKPMRAMADSFLAFKLKDFNKVLDHLSKTKFIDTRDKFNVKSLSLMTYYELGDIVTLMYNIETVKQFVSKNPSLGEITRVNFNSFLIYLRKLIALKEKSEKMDIGKIKKEIEADKSIVNRSWLLEKLNELEK